MKLLDMNHDTVIRDKRDKLLSDLFLLGIR